MKFALLLWSTSVLGALGVGLPEERSDSALASSVAVTADEGEQGAASFAPELFGVVVRVPEIAPAVAFYTGALPFEVAGFVGQEAALLRLDQLHLWLTRVDGAAAPIEEARTNVNLYVPDLAASADAVIAGGGDAGDVAPFALGESIEAADPWGNPFELLHVTVGEEAGRAAPGVYNVGVNATDYALVEPFLAALGFRVLSRAYLPTALPYEPAGATSLVVHDGAERPATSAGRRNALALAVGDLDGAIAALRALDLAPGEPRPSPFGRTSRLLSPSRVELVLVERSPEQLAFERLRSLAGTWRGASTQGWEARIEFEVIARGSVVLQRSNFEAHPNETMLTAYHRDGSRLVLTHYCVAGNQPTMAAEEITGDSIAFAFHDATNIASRDEGHMDAARLTFDDEGHFHSRWSWYQSGAESWMEEIRYERE